MTCVMARIGEILFLCAVVSLGSFVDAVNDNLDEGQLLLALDSQDSSNTDLNFRDDSYHPYWKHWRCTHSRFAFLRKFYRIMKSSKYSCETLPPELMTSPDSLHHVDFKRLHKHQQVSSDNEERIGAHELRSVPGIHSRKRRQTGAAQNVDLEFLRGGGSKAENQDTGEMLPMQSVNLTSDGEEGPGDGPDDPEKAQVTESYLTTKSESDSDQETSSSPSATERMNRDSRAYQELLSSNESEIHYSSIHLKKLRGCQWENSSHYCVQYIVFAIEEPHCVPLFNNGSHGEGHVLEEEKEDDIVNDILEAEYGKPPLTKVWGYGLASCTVVIIVGRLGVILVPLLRIDWYKSFVIATVGLAAGTLTGSSIFHLLPKAFSLDDQYEGKKTLNRCLVIATGLWLFLVIERLLKIVLHHKERLLHTSRKEKVENVLAHEGNFRVRSISVVSLGGRRQSSDAISLDIADSHKTDAKRPSTYEGDKESEKEKRGRDDCNCSKSDEVKDKLDFEFNTIRFQEGQLSSVSTQAWMIIVGDSFLDFVDGLSIGTAFQDSILTGASISLGILLDELPHELGEFAVLLTAGLTFYQALLYKAIASCTTYLGLAVGIWLGGVEAGHYVFALAAGMFLYIAMVDMIPELNEAAIASSKASVKKGLKVLFLQNLGLLLGMATIYLMALHEDVFKKL